MATSFFERQLAGYAGYHRDPRNRATHFIGIPAIAFSIMILGVIPEGFGVVSWAVIVTAVFAVVWLSLDIMIGLALAAAAIPMLVVAEILGRHASEPVLWVLFAIFFIGGWALQLVGHVWEGRRPALLDNLFQAVVGPMFIMAEALIALGLKQDLKTVVEKS
jgi:uncharacterized membrane protein YGL010W